MWLNLRNKDTDDYIESTFGKPNWNRACVDIDTGTLLTPIGNLPHFWRVDKLSLEELQKLHVNRNGQKS